MGAKYVDQEGTPCARSNGEWEPLVVPQSLWHMSTCTKSEDNVMSCFISGQYGYVPTNVEPFMAVFVDIDGVVTQSKHTVRRGYQRARQTDAGVPLHVVPLIESARAIYRCFEGIMRIQMAPDSISRLGPLVISLYLYFVFSVIWFPPVLIFVFIHSLTLFWNSF